MMSSSLFTGLASSRPWSVQGGLTRHTEMCTGDMSRAIVFLMFPKTDFSLSKKKNTEIVLGEGHCYSMTVEI